MGYVIGIALVIFIGCGIAQLNKIPNPKEEVSMNASKRIIEKKCGVLGSDLLWTTAMDKIAKCIEDKYWDSDATRVTCGNGFELIGYKAEWGEGESCCKTEKNGHVKHCTIIEP